MCRISAENQADRFVLKLEGCLSGAWVAELETSWRAAAETPEGRPIWVDLTEVYSVDDAGRQLLSRMARHGVGFVAKGCFMPELVREISGGPR